MYVSCVGLCIPGTLSTHAAGIFVPPSLASSLVYSRRPDASSSSLNRTCSSMFGRARSLSSRVQRHVNSSRLRAQIRSLSCSNSRCSHSDSNKDVRHILDDIPRYSKINQVLLFESQIHDPYINLAIENYLLARSDPTSRILLFYVNHPCVVIGRNQNPWLECNIPQLGSREKQTFDLVRRRSGGGTVVHDRGNLNFSFIVPNDKDFRRDAHGQLVVNALGSAEVFDAHQASRLYRNVRINTRHDIVMSKTGPEPYQEYKVSGSAYKLTKGRALHHGTILHSSPHVSNAEKIDNGESWRGGRTTFSTLLSSPARPFLEAKGVESVRSPVHNLFAVTGDEGRDAVQNSIIRAVSQQFREVYQAAAVRSRMIQAADVLLNPQVSRDAKELRTLGWRFSQTPLFRYRSPRDIGIQLEFQVKQGIIQDLSCDDIEVKKQMAQQLEGRKLHEVESWTSALAPVPGSVVQRLSLHLDIVFPNVDKLGFANEEETPSSSKVVQANRLHVVREKGAKREIEEVGENTVVVD